MANTLKFGNGEWYGKKDTILAYNDLNSNYKPLPFNFSRDSSATVINKDGLIETVGSDMPRIDYKDDSKGALLLEPQSTNLVPRSEDIDTGWSKLNVTVSNNQTVSPYGTLNAALITVTSTNGQHASYDTLSSSATSGQPYYISCFVKKYNSKYIRLNEGYTGATLGVNLDDGTYNLTNGASDAIIEVFENGWYRIGFKFTPTTTDSQFALYINDNNNENSYAGNGEAVYIWGAQVEKGSYATSYIPTQGSAVTRLADNCSQTTPDSVIGQTEGTIFAHFKRNGNIVVRGGVVFLREDSLRGLSINYINNTLYATSRNDAAINTVLLKTPFDINETAKVAITYNGSVFSGFLNGVKIFTDSVFNPFDTIVTAIRVSYGANSGSDAEIAPNSMKDVRVYNKALTDAELIALTQL